MDLERFSRQLQLMVILTRNHTMSVEDISLMLKMNRRSIYRYIDLFKQMGFVVIKERGCYRLDYSSPFFTQITSKIHFTTDEAITINQILNSVYDNSSQVRHLRAKLASLYDFNVLKQHGVDSHIAHNLSVLFQAVQTQRVVKLVNYRSPHSGKVSDRLVEPYLFLSDNSEVRCYELATEMNKTFKISRAEDVQLLEVVWIHEDQHAPLYTDLFHFSSEKRYQVKLLLGPLSTSLLLEEFPLSEEQMKLQDDGRYLLTTDVCSFKGVGRFVLGLYDDIEVVDSPDFQCYLQERINNLTQKSKK